MSDSEHMTATAGETLEEHPRKDGPIVSRIESVTPGDNTLTVEADVSALRRAIRTDMRDSYQSVHLWCDGNRLAITDHRKPIESADPDTFDGFSERVVRASVVEPPDDGQRTLIKRESLLTALDEFDESDTVGVLVEEDWPVIFRTSENAVGVAPKLNESVQQKAGG